MFSIVSLIKKGSYEWDIYQLIDYTHMHHVIMSIHKQVHEINCNQRAMSVFWLCFHKFVRRSVWNCFIDYALLASIWQWNTCEHDDWWKNTSEWDADSQQSLDCASCEWWLQRELLGLFRLARRVWSLSLSRR